ncbi:MAG: DNA-binding protein [Candidatus Aureabacteria bacterium]|nr:DNA-binding protein [Candidatus Auribacterota bacterium]
MRYCEVTRGRTFVLNLEEGEILHEVIERFAAEHGIRAAALILVGAAGAGSRLVVGPEDGGARPVAPIEHTFEDVYELSGTGTIFPDERCVPVLHMHAACGRGDRAVTGCVRRGVRIWQIAEVVIIELQGAEVYRQYRPELGFSLLSFR